MGYLNLSSVLGHRLFPFHKPAGNLQYPLTISRTCLLLISWLPVPLQCSADIIKKFRYKHSIHKKWKSGKIVYWHQFKEITETKQMIEFAFLDDIKKCKWYSEYSKAFWRNIQHKNCCLLWWILGSVYIVIMLRSSVSTVML